MFSNTTINPNNQTQLVWVYYVIKITDFTDSTHDTT